MSDFIVGKIKPWSKFVKENLKEFEIQKGSQFEAKLYLAYEETMQLFKTAEYQLNYKITELEKKLSIFDKLSDDLGNILGRPNFWCGSFSRNLRDAGHVIPKKAESEQAYVIHWMLKLYIEHGTKWAKEGDKQIKAAINSAKLKV